MRILTIHADYIEVEPKERAIRKAEEIVEKLERYNECLVVFTAVEDGDGKNVLKMLVDEIESIAKQVKTNSVVLYPLVHLTSNPADPDSAMELIKKAEDLLRKKIKEVNRVPFGWYKAYTLRCKGHPLSELSREFVEKREEEKASEALKKESNIASKFYIMDLDGRLIEAEKFDYKKYLNLKKFAEYEVKKVRAYKKEPPHIKLMKEHRLVDYEEGTDSGNFRFYPKGKLMKSLLERAITKFCVDYGAVEVETPIMYSFEHPSLKKYLNRFPARQYTLKSDEHHFFLRFSACFGQFLMTHDAIVSYKNLPLKMFELTQCFRREQSGELAGLKRLRGFTMPDMHTLVATMEDAKKEFESQLEMGKQWMEILGLESEVGFRVFRKFFDENKTWYQQMVKKLGKPVLFEIYDEMYAYFITKFEFNFVDSMDKASALTTVQIDVENAETYDLYYVDEDGQKKRPYILHASISGSIERVIYALLEREAMKMAEGKKGNFELWLSPTQVRIIPVNFTHIEYAKQMMKLFLGRVRVDVDDREETLNKKIMDAEKEWVPYIAVVGPKEISSGELSVSMRKEGIKRGMRAEELLKKIEDETKGKPFEDLSIPKLLSKRPKL